MIKNYLMLTKPGIIFGNLFTAAAGFILASQNGINYLLFTSMLLGLSLIIASACVFNNYIDRFIDEKMSRTKNRALVLKTISERDALIFGSTLLALGIYVLGVYTNTLTLSTALLGVFFYVVVYGIYKRASSIGTVVGSIAGAIPALVGYTAVSGTIDFAALIVFLIVVFWQMPHFYAIAMFRMKDYKAAAIPVLPLEKGIYTTKVHMLLYVVAFAIATASLTYFGYTGYTYLTIASILSIGWLILSIKGFSTDDNNKWARQMFFYSLIAIMTLSAGIAVNHAIDLF